jgi:hypothetical protein
MEASMKANWQIWSLVLAAVVLLVTFGRLGLLAVIMPLSLVVACGAWLAKRSNSSSAR